MLNRKLGGFLLAGSFLMAGCATTTGGRTNQADIDALNARVAALQGQLSEKDQELNSLQNQVADLRAAREEAEAALRSAKTVAAKAPASDLK